MVPGGCHGPTLGPHALKTPRTQGKIRHLFPTAWCAFLTTGGVEFAAYIECVNEQNGQKDNNTSSRRTRRAHYFAWPFRLC